MRRNDGSPAGIVCLRSGQVKGSGSCSECVLKAGAVRECKVEAKEKNRETTSLDPEPFAASQNNLRSTTQLTSNPGVRLSLSTAVFQASKSTSFIFLPTLRPSQLPQPPTDVVQ